MPVDWDRTMRDARTIFHAALERVDPCAMISRCLGIKGNTLVVRTESGELRFPLDAFDRIMAGMGKDIASLDILDRARAAGLHPASFLANNDSYGFFDSCGGLLRTGPTGTNVCDIQILLVPSA
ncbi:MAG: MOFRL family protein [Rectinemataceae bacterium]